MKATVVDRLNETSQKYTHQYPNQTTLKLSSADYDAQIRMVTTNRNNTCGLRRIAYEVPTSEE